MVSVEVIAVGKELLIGRTLNTNAYWAGGRLAKIGTQLERITTVDDEISDIASSLREALGRSPDFVVVMGGLGPTPDDMTLRGIASGLEVAIKPDGRALELIKEHYEKIGLKVELTAARRKMARLPAGAQPLRNSVGTAPGVRMLAGKTTIFSLPGVPAEMKGMFRRAVEPEVSRLLGKLHREYVTLRFEGIFESTLAPIISRAMKRHPDAYIKSHPGGLRKGVSRIQLEIALVGRVRGRVAQEAAQVAREVTEKAKAMGASVMSAGDAIPGSGA